jgi:hypothetical protein
MSGEVVNAPNPSPLTTHGLTFTIPADFVLSPGCSQVHVKDSTCYVQSQEQYVNSNGQADDRRLRFFSFALQRKSSNVKSKLEALFFLENLISKYGSHTSTPKSARGATSV